MNKVICIAVLLFLSLSSCKKADLNDTDENGTFSLYFKATVDGAAWAATPANIGAAMDNNSVPSKVSIHADLKGSNDHFYLIFPPMLAKDTSISSIGMLNFMQFQSNSKTWISVTGNLKIHKDGTVKDQQYSGTFSGTFINAADRDTIMIANGVYMAQGKF